MRLDVLLHDLCLYKTRSQAGRACDDGRVRVNGEVAKASRAMKVGDVIAYRDPGDRFEREVELLVLPEKAVSRVQARDFYQVRSERPVALPWEAPRREGD